MERTHRRRDYLAYLKQDLLTHPQPKQLAHLANFAYDEFNHKLFLELNLPQLFLYFLNDENSKLREFSLSGLCNLSSNEVFHTVIDTDCIISSYHTSSISGKRACLGILFYKCNDLSTDQIETVLKLEATDIVCMNLLKCIKYKLTEKTST